MRKSKLKQFRKAFKVFSLEKISWRIDNGQMDYHIEEFLKGDTLEIGLKITFLPNDVIFMRTLLGLEITPEIRKKMHKMWRNEREDDGIV